MHPAPRCLLAIATLAVTGCSEAQTNLACPLLAPGASALLSQASPLVVPPLDAAAPSEVAGALGPGALAGHPIWLAAGERVRVEAKRATGGAMVIMTYGPRDAFGGYPGCTTLATSGAATLRADAAGEWLVVVGLPPGEGQAEYTVTTTCREGVCGGPRCPTLAESGCPDVRCDGELAASNGCLSCTCNQHGLCGPDRSAGPGGTCLLPACGCDAAATDPVCGADGATWPSACAALCAGVPIARAEACSIACPALATCDSACFGLRALGADGCPTCACASDFAENPESCAACPEASAPTCGSDGVTYRNPCAARCAGARVMLAGACPDEVAWPAGCTIDCAFGLRPVAGGQSALACDCAPAPTLACPPRGAPVCATLPGPAGETTVQSACVAVALGATGTDAVWGPCGVRCESDDACANMANSGPALCQTTGFLSGRCLLADVPACGCAAVVDPVCGRDGATYDNACLAHCEGVAVAYGGPCCAAPVACAEGVPLLDARGCQEVCGDAGDAVCVPESAVVAPACDLDGAVVEGHACQAHARGVTAFPELCP